MIPCLIKTMRTIMNNHAFTMVELMMAVAFTVLLMTGVYGFYNVSSQTYSAGISGQTLQDAANIALSQIIEGKTESTGVYRLSTAKSYYIPNAQQTLFIAKYNILLCGTDYVATARIPHISARCTI